MKITYWNDKGEKMSEKEINNLDYDKKGKSIESNKFIVIEEL